MGQARASEARPRNPRGPSPPWTSWWSLMCFANWNMALISAQRSRTSDDVAPFRLRPHWADWIATIRLDLSKPSTQSKAVLELWRDERVQRDQGTPEWEPREKQVEAQAARSAHGEAGEGVGRADLGAAVPGPPPVLIQLPGTSCEKASVACQAGAGAG